MAIEEINVRPTTGLGVKRRIEADFEGLDHRLRFGPKGTVYYESTTKTSVSF
jgi:hypothetical protein